MPLPSEWLRLMQDPTTTPQQLLLLVPILQTMRGLKQKDKVAFCRALTDPRCREILVASANEYLERRDHAAH